MGEEERDGTGLLPGCEIETRPVVGEHERKPRLRPIDRNQMVLQPLDIDRLVPEDHEARAIWELVGSLDLSSYYDRIDSLEGRAGAPAFDPHLLVSLWVYAYSKGISSAREIARLSEYDPAYQWLTGLRPVNYHTLADFRSSHGDSLRLLFIEVLALLSKEGLITMERVMHDGTKIKASAGADTFRREATIREHLTCAEAQVKAMEDAPEEEMTPRIRKARERAVRERKERLASALDELARIRSYKRSKAERASETDPECRIMSQSDGGFAPSYNVQISTDANEKAIVSISVSQSPSDQTLLPSAIDEIEKSMGTLPRQLVVDAGFTTRETILAADEHHIDLVGSFIERGTPETLFCRWGITEAFRPEKFLFDEERNCYVCPEGKLLVYLNKETRWGRTVFNYRGKECRDCPSKPQCCPRASKGRVVSHRKNDPRVDAFLAKMKTPEAKAIYRSRAGVAEFPHAWIKEKFGLRQFHLRGLVKVGIEAFWVCLTYNIKLWIRRCWRQGAYAAA